jgi:Activator of Hsp90 ATPase homolog 1-like protein
MSQAKRKHEPVRQRVHVECPIDETFRLFTEAFSEWWPLALDSCFLEPWPGGRVFERTASGEEFEWGSVTGWDPPRHLRLSWLGSQTVDVEFKVDARGTEVTVIHTGWEAPWPAIARHFASFASDRVLAFA